MAVVPLRTDRPEFIPIFKRFSISLISVSRKRKLRFMERVLGRAISSYAFTLNSLGYTREWVAKGRPSWGKHKLEMIRQSACPLRLTKIVINTLSLLTRNSFTISFARSLSREQVITGSGLLLCYFTSARSLAIKVTKSPSSPSRSLTFPEPAVDKAGRGSRSLHPLDPITAPFHSRSMKLPDLEDLGFTSPTIS